MRWADSSSHRSRLEKEAVDAARLLFPEVEFQVEACGAERGRQRFDAEPRQLEIIERRVLEGERDLEDRIPAEVAGRRQLLDQALEGEVLVGEGEDDRLLRASQQFTKAGIAARVDAERKRVHEEAD
ncbi:MAG: hypothetical protein U0527_02220 [Candidatus Eisenbacteria bacterium]